VPVLLAALGVLAISLDSAVNVALPDMAAAFGVGPAAIRWVIVCYVLTYALTAFAGGVVADRVGAPPVFALGLALSAAVFVGYGAAGSYAAVLLLRVAQGVGGGLVYGTAPALVTLALPSSRRGRGLGLMSAGLGAGLVAGPLVGGALVAAWGWRAAFVFRAPVMAAVALLAVLRRPPGMGGRPGARLPAASAILRWPVLRALALALVATCAQFAVWLLAPFYLMSILGLGPRAGGALFVLTALGTAVASPAVGLVTDRAGPRMPMLAGLALETAGLLALSRCAADSPLWLAALGLLLVGVGVGAFQVPNLAELMGAFPPGQQGAAGGLGFLGRTLGSAAGAQLAGAVYGAWVGEVGEVGAMRAAFSVAAAVAMVALALAVVPARSSSRARAGAL
jgi:DHA2 family methylenomycin A resistance protein-like MFS transporter